MSNTKSKALYNYLVNTLGLNKDIVLEYIDKRLEDLLNKQIKDKLSSKESEKMILNNLIEIVQNGVQTNTSYWWKKQPFEDYIKKIIKNVIEEKLDNEYTLQVKMIRKDKKIIHHAD